MRISDWSTDVCSSDLTSPARTSLPRRVERIGPSSLSAVWRQSEVPAWKSQSSVASTLCQWDFCPASSRNNIAVAVPRAPSGDSTRQVSRYQPPSGWGCRRSEEHTSELQSLMRISYAVFCLKKKNTTTTQRNTNNTCNTSPPPINYTHKR